MGSDSGGTTGRDQHIDTEWVALQRIVSVGMILVLLAPMVAIAQQFILPLGIVSALFGLALALTWFRPRVGAIGIGVLSGVWFLSQVINYTQVIPDLTRPSETLFFLITVGMLAFSIAGLAGLVGVLRNSSGHMATRTLQLVGVATLGGVVLTALSSV